LVLDYCSCCPRSTGIHSFASSHNTNLIPPTDRATIAIWLSCTSTTTATFIFIYRVTVAAVFCVCSSIDSTNMSLVIPESIWWCGKTTHSYSQPERTGRCASWPPTPVLFGVCASCSVDLWMHLFPQPGQDAGIYNAIQTLLLLEPSRRVFPQRSREFVELLDG
jgi:hypothetical protein